MRSLAVCIAAPWIAGGAVLVMAWAWLCWLR
jgi:hypothetical protein